MTILSAFGVFLLCLMAGCNDSGPGSGLSTGGGESAVVPTADQPLPALVARSPARSAGLFIGVGHFRYEPSLHYTVNDAVDLASSLVELGLLPVHRTHLLLSGEPSGASRDRYEKMKGDALIGSPTRANIKSALTELASLAGPEGVLYIFFATHGYSDGVKSYLMAADTMSGVLESAVSAEDILEATRGFTAPIVLILDTCRVRVTSAVPTQENEGSAPPGSRSAEPKKIAENLIQAQTSRPGYAVLYATDAGGRAWPDEERQNGIFTGAILDGLRCSDASADVRAITLFSLASFVQTEVRRRSRGWQSAELLFAEGFRDFVTVRCGPIGDILEPKEGQVVSPREVVVLRAHQPGLFARAVLQAESNGVYYVQQPQLTFPAVPETDVRIPVDYGGPSGFQVYVALSADPDFLGEVTQLSSRPGQDRRGRPVIWLGPVHVVLPSGEP